jgi:Protein of unknown function (DUF2637)
VTAGRPQERPEKWASRAATATVAGLAGIAGAISYSHKRQLAAALGDTGWHAHAFPSSMDGAEIVASLVLLADRRAGRNSGWLPWAALSIGTAASLPANIATANTGTVSRVCGVACCGAAADRRQAAVRHPGPPGYRPPARCGRRWTRQRTGTGADCPTGRIG